MKLEFSRQIFEKYSYIKFHKSHSVGTKSLHADGQTDEHTDMLNLHVLCQGTFILCKL